MTKRKKHPGRPRGKWEYAVVASIPLGSGRHRTIERDEAVTKTMVQAKKAAQRAKVRYQPTVTIKKYRIG